MIEVGLQSNGTPLDPTKRVVKRYSWHFHGYFQPNGREPATVHAQLQLTRGQRAIRMQSCGVCQEPSRTPDALNPTSRYSKFNAKL